jgi:hypothetical protein
LATPIVGSTLLPKQRNSKKLLKTAKTEKETKNQT